MPSLEDVRVLAEGLEFPEGPIAEPDGAVLLVEMTGHRLSRVRDGAVEKVVEVDAFPNGAAYGPDGAVYITAWGSGSGRILRFDESAGTVEVLYDQCDGVPFLNPNDLVFDAAGGFWFTDYRGGALHYALADGSSVTKVVDQARTPNGVGLSPDGGTLYWAETQTRQVHRRTIVRPGVVEPTPGCDSHAVAAGAPLDPGSILAGFGGYCELDSLAVDSAGNVCVGTLLGGGITVVAPDGSAELYSLPDGMADLLVTNICFGGDDMTTAYITLSQTGRLIRCRWPRPGLRLAYERRGGHR